MIKRIEKLTPAQEARLDEWRDRWIAVGLKTDPADWPRFEKAARECYSIINLNPGVPIVHVPSPIVGAFAAPIAASIINITKAIRGIDVKDKKAVRSAVDSAVHSAVDSAVHSAVDSAVRSAVRSAVGKNNNNLIFWHYWMGGQMWSSWASYESFFREVCNLNLGEGMERRAIAYAETVQSACYWWPNRDFIIVCDRPVHILRNERGRLHSSEKKAIEWPDGWGLWMWHGTRVSEQIIMKPETLSREQIMAEKNSEVSRAIAERLGWDEYLKRVDTVLIHKWFDEMTSCHYELYDFKERKGSLQPRLLKMESPALNDESRPYYIEPVPPESQTCQAARRWQNDPSRPKIKECNENPHLVFEVEA